jgi:hypothetical protein
VSSSFTNGRVFRGAANVLTVNVLVVALVTGVTAIVAVVVGVVALAALEARLLDPRRGVLGTLARALRLALSPPPPSADHALGVSAAVISASVPVAAAVLLLADPTTAPVASGLLCLGAAGPLLAAVAAGVDERARLGLFDALAATTRRLLALVACAVASPEPVAAVVVGVFAAIVLVRARHRGAATLLPRWEDALAGRFLVLHRIGERATVVAVVFFVGVVVRGLFVGRVDVVAHAAGVLAAGATVVVAVAGTRRLGPQHGEALGGPLALLGLAAALRAALPLLR